jgi:hypothetical protein
MKLDGHLNAIILGELSTLEQKFLVAGLEWQGFQPIRKIPKLDLKNFISPEPNSKNSEILILDNPSDPEIEELMVWNLDVAIITPRLENWKNIAKAYGIPKIWTRMDLLPLFTPSVPNPREISPEILIHTGRENLDRFLGSVFRTAGYRTYSVLESSHLPFRIQNQKPDLILINWDLGIVHNVQSLQDLQRSIVISSREISVIGITDFRNPGISQKLAQNLPPKSWILLDLETTIRYIISGLFSQKNLEPENQSWTGFHFLNHRRFQMGPIEIESQIRPKTPSFSHNAIQLLFFEWIWESRELFSPDEI